MITNAVILAAGLGHRLKDRTKLKPKGFLKISDQSLIERSVEKLLNCGIKNIYIGTGYLSDVYEQFAEKYTEISCIKSEKYETTSSMFTLYNMRKHLTDDFLLLESDLLYEKLALTSLLDDDRDDVILASGKTNSCDEVYISIDENKNLLSMSKNVDEIDKIYGELVGISKVSIERYRLLCELFANQDNPKIDYEYMFVASAKLKHFDVKKQEDLIWCEIDDENHLNRALENILPKLIKKGEA